MTNSIRVYEDNNSFLNIILKGSLSALTSRSIQLLSDKVNDRWGWHLGQVLSVIMPSPIRRVFTLSKKILQYPINWFSEKIQNFYLSQAERLNLPDYERERKELRRDLFIKIIYAPVLEEIIYRGIAQTGVSACLEMFRIDPLLSKIISIFCATVMFGMAHEPKIAQIYFTRSAVAGFVMGVTKEIYGLPTSIVAHMLHNCSIIVIDKLSKSRFFQ